MLVRDVMSTQLVTLAAEENVSLAEQLMKAIDARHLPVLAEGGHLVGLVSDRDLLAAAASSLAEIGEVDARSHKRRIPVQEIMSRELRVVEPTTPLLEAATQMRAHKIGCLPVMDGGSLVGIVTESDLVDVLIGALRSQTNPPDAPPQAG